MLSKSRVADNNCWVSSDNRFLGLLAVLGRAPVDLESVFVVPIEMDRFALRAFVQLLLETAGGTLLTFLERPVRTEF